MLVSSQYLTVESILSEGSLFRCFVCQGNSSREQMRPTSILESVRHFSPFFSMYGKVAVKEDNPA